MITMINYYYKVLYCKKINLIKKIDLINISDKIINIYYNNHNGNHCFINYGLS